METRRRLSFLLLTALLVSGLLMTGCPGETIGEVTEDPPPPSQNFALRVDPSGFRNTLDQWDASAKTLTAVVLIPENATAPQFQWYSKDTPSSAGTAIEGETSASYSPTITAEGNYYYYVVVSTTVDGERKELTANVSILIGAVTPADTSFSIGEERVHYVRGVGGTGSFMFREGDNADASPDADVKYIDMLFGEMGCNILRVMVQDDYKNYVTNTIQSRNANVFRHDASRNFFAVIKRVNELGGYVFANPWTAPAEFKAPTSGSGAGSIRGGILRTTASNYVGYANYLREFLQWLNDNDAPIFALGICNEPDYGQNANYEGMGMERDVHRDWFRTVGHFTTQFVTNQSGAGVTSSIFDDDIIPGFGGGKKTHHVLAMTGDNMGAPGYYDLTIDNQAANNNFEILGRHWYAGGAGRITKLAGAGPTSSNPTGTIWERRPGNYEGRYEAESLAMSPQMFAPGSTPGNIKREVWQTEHDFNYWQNSTEIHGSNVQRSWNSAFAAMNDVDWAMRVVHESVFDWWFSSSYSGLVTSYQGAPVNGNGQGQVSQSAGAIPWRPYEYTPRGRAFAHYARYVNETWTLPIEQTKTKTGTNMTFNRTGVSPAAFNAGATDPKISAFEDVNGQFISIVMFTPSASTNTSGPSASTSGAIDNDFGRGGITLGTDDPRMLSANVGRVEVVLPGTFTATSASALRSYGWENADGKDWDDVPNGTPRYWINEPVFLYKTADNKWAVEVTLPGGNIISIMVKGTWPGREVASPERVRPYKEL